MYDEQSGCCNHTWRNRCDYECYKKGKKVIAIPRLAKYGEHVDDHQIEIVGEFKNLDLICECNDIENLSDALDKVTTHEYKKYESNTQRILDNIEKFIDLI